MDSTKSKLQQIKEILFSSEAKDVKLAERKLEDGVTVLEAESFEVGQTVNVKAEDGQLIPLPVGEYKLEDGMILVVEEEGIIAAMKEPEAEGTEPEAEEEVAASNKPSESPLPKSIVETVAKETKFSSEDKEALETKIVELEAKVTELTKEETETVEETVEATVEPTELAKPLKHNPENIKPVKKGIKFAQNRTQTTKDRVMNKILNIKN